MLEDWILVGLKLKHPLPIIAGIALNKEPSREPVAALCMNNPLCTPESIGGKCVQ